MKKLISVILLFALLLSCCACGADPQQNNPGNETTTQPTETSGGEGVVTPPQKDEKEDFSHINELEPNSKGVYQLHSAKGVLNIVNHPDAKFELLCNIDMEGAVWTPVGTKDAPFTGSLNGKTFTISNFKIEAATADGDMGLVAVNKGTIQQLNLKDVTIVTTDSAKRVGGIAGTNEGNILRCEVHGSMQVAALAADAFCGGAVGLNTGNLRNTIVGMDILSTASGNAAIGGLTGKASGGSVRDSDAMGKLDITSGKGKKIGTLAGIAENVELLRCSFQGETNKIDGKLFNNYMGKSSNSKAEDCRWRDNSAEPISAEARALREKVVQAMYDMGTVLWTVPETVETSCVPTCNAVVCRKMLVVGTMYRGLPYKHNYASLDQHMFCLDENNVMLDWVVDQGTIGGYQNYMGSSCYVSCQLAWAVVANSMNSANSMSTVIFPEECNVIPVGNWGNKWPLENRRNDGYTYKIRNYMTEQEYYEDLALIRAGDVTTRVLNNGAHSQMAATDAVVIRKDDGTIDPALSHVYIHDQGSGESNCSDFVTTWGIGIKWTFSRMYDDSMLPVTIEELVTGKMETPVATMEGNPGGYMGLMTGKVTSNYFVDSVTVKVTDSKGETVFEKKLFARVEDIEDYNIIPMNSTLLVTEFDMAYFTPSIMEELELYSGENYHAVITANLFTQDHIVVQELDF